MKKLDYESIITNISNTINAPTKKDKNNSPKSFLDKYEMYIGLSIFGIGIFSLLAAILTKSKKSKIM